MDALKRREPAVKGVVAATRGNHGQSIALAARRNGLAAVVVVPHGNSVEKNAAMRALGAELIEHGHDFQAAYEHAAALAQERKLHRQPSFHPQLVTGVATYGLELFRALPDLDTVYVPIGLGSGICGTIAARECFGAQDKGGWRSRRERGSLCAVLRQAGAGLHQQRRHYRRRHGLPGAR